MYGTELQIYRRFDKKLIDEDQYNKMIDLLELEINKIGAFMYYLRKTEIKGQKFKKPTQTPIHKPQTINRITRSIMKKMVVLLIALGSILTCYSQQTEFPEEALRDVFVDMDGNDIHFASVLEKHKGKSIFIDIWASWCSDCVKGMPGVKKLMSENTEVQFLFLSLDRTQDRWKSGIERFGIEDGDHYFIKAGWKESAFCSSINLDWIPRYIVVDSNGKIIVFKAIKTNDQNLINTLKTLQ